MQPSKWDRRAAAKAEAIMAGSKWLLCEQGFCLVFRVYNFCFTAYKPFSSDPSKQMRYEAFLRGKRKFVGVYKRGVKGHPKCLLTGILSPLKGVIMSNLLSGREPRRKRSLLGQHDCSSPCQHHCQRSLQVVQVRQRAR